MEEPHVFTEMPATRMVGLSMMLKDDAASEIPALWQQFAAKGSALLRPGVAAYGICTTQVGGMHYMVAVAAEVTSALPQGFEETMLAARRYAVFPHTGNVDTIRETIERAGEWLEQSDAAPNDRAPFLEYYGPGFDPQKGEGDIEIRMPLRA